MFAGHLPEILIIAVVALLFLGPKRLPEAGKSIGQAIRVFKSEVSDEHHSATPVRVEADNDHTTSSVQGSGDLEDMTSSSHRPIA